MGSFANTVFSLLLGWMQGLIAIIWSALTDQGGESVFQFIGDHWIRIAIILCAVGLIADFLVYFFRWAPYKVWRSFFRRLSGRKEREQEADDGAQAGWQVRETAQDGDGFRDGAAPAYAETGRWTSRTEGSYGLHNSRTDWADEEPGQQAYPADRAEEAYGLRDPREDGPEESYDDLRRWEPEEAEEPEVPAEITRAGYTVPADSPYRRPGSGGRRRRLRLNLLGDGDENGEIHYLAPRPMMDQKDAYHAPVYPERWKESREQDS